jgi:polyphosphate kinase 2
LFWLLENEGSTLPERAMKTPDSPKDRLSKSDYAEQLGPIELRLNNLARWLKASKRRIVVVLEGRDAAGKGGTIAALTGTLNPRQVRAVALSAPDERERSQWYFQRYVQHLPSAGEMVLFDRSWYNRAGVEQVMGFCSKAEVETFLKQAPVFEQMLVGDGILLFKYWLTVDQAEQEARFAERLNDPLKRWKLSPIDLAAREHYADYGLARDRMLKATHTAHAPWSLVNFNDQRRGRIDLLNDFLDRLAVPEIAPEKLNFPRLRSKPLLDRTTPLP